jgi:hypothetical protein
MMMSNLLSNGIKSTLDKNAAFAQTQAAWRFFNNDACTLSSLMNPIVKQCKKQLPELCQKYALIAHDWSGIVYKTHASKKDLHAITNKKHLGYDLQTSLLLSDIHGGAIAPIAMSVVSDKKIMRTYKAEEKRGTTHLEELVECINHIESAILPEKNCVHIIDREADSVRFMRALKNKKWLLRSKGESFVTHNNQSVRIDTLAKQLTFSQSREIMHLGNKVEQHLAEANVKVTRAAQIKNENGKKRKVSGEAISARLVVSKIVDQNNKIIAWWYLLTNVPGVSVGDIALWYYWRWSIESFFKLLKTAGMQIESWQQETLEAIARRLLVASMACVCVWQIAEAKGPDAGELRDLLIRLSGKQMKYGIRFTRPALFTGLCSLLNAFDLIKNYDIDYLQNIFHKIVGVDCVLQI